MSGRLALWPCGLHCNLCTSLVWSSFDHFHSCKYYVHRNWWLVIRPWYYFNTNNGRLHTFLLHMLIWAWNLSAKTNSTMINDTVIFSKEFKHTINLHCQFAYIPKITYIANSFEQEVVEFFLPLLQWALCYNG